MARMINIACLQTRPMPDFQSAIAEALSLAQKAVQGGADLLFLPEYAGGLCTKDARLDPPAAHQTFHPFIEAMSDFAKAQNVWVSVGSVAVKGDAAKVFNRGFLIDNKGQTVGTYDKIHMFDVVLSANETYCESDTVIPGDEAVLFQLPDDIGAAKIGHTICYDLRFPDLYRKLAQNGAEILAVPAAFTKTTGMAHWHVLNRARAIENGAFVVAPCAVGEIPGGGESYGHSLIIDPWGQIIADGGSQPGVIFAEIDLDFVLQTRAKIPSLSNDRNIEGPVVTRYNNERNAA